MNDGFTSARPRAIALVLVLAACGGDGGHAVVDPPPGDDGSPRIAAATVVVDSSALLLVGDSASRASGVYRFRRTGSSQEIAPGKIIAGAQAGGFLRRVTGTSAAGDTLVLTTVQAALDEAIERGEFQITTTVAPPGTQGFRAPVVQRSPDGSRVVVGPVSLSRIAPGVSFAADGIHLTNVSLYSSPDGSLRLSVPTGILRFSPSLDVGATFGFGLKKFHAVASGDLSASADLLLQSTGGAQASGQTTLWEYHVPFAAQVGPVPVTGEAVVAIVGAYSAGADLTTSVTSGFDASSHVSVGARYEDGTWSSVAESSPTFSTHPTLWESEANVQARLSIRPVVSVSFYRVTGPYVQAEPYAAFSATFRASDGFWKRELTVGLNGAFGGRVSVLGHTLLEQELPWTGPSRVVFADSGTAAGTLSGRVVDGRTYQPLADATLTFRRAGVGIATARSGADGRFASPRLAAGTYSVAVEKPGWVAATVNEVRVARDRDTEIEPVPLVPQSPYPGAVSGTVRNARNNAPIPGATVEIRAGVNATAGAALTGTTTGSAGAYRLSGLAAGTYTVVARAGGYADGIRTGIVVGQAEISGQDVVLSPTGAADELRVVLTWGASPADIDSHLTGPTTDGGRFHVYYAALGALDVSPFAALDIDDRSGYGPETVTIIRQLSGTYRYSVHDYSNRGATSSTALASSGARVDVYRGNTLLRRFFVPGGGGTLWTVFDLNGSTITPINTMSYDFSFDPTRLRGSAAPTPPKP